jgi:hypothetical protein
MYYVYATDIQLHEKYSWVIEQSRKTGDFAISQFSFVANSMKFNILFLFSLLNNKCSKSLDLYSESPHFCYFYYLLYLLRNQIIKLVNLIPHCYLLATFHAATSSIVCFRIK